MLKFQPAHQYGLYDWGGGVPDMQPFLSLHYGFKAMRDQLYSGNLL